ncbi:unnamed protein product [Linum tenue]|uniref:Uncharacterized protein n=1 Tax=Linum tenue TaxID=586396 RepID=A0AAV0JHI1_9ROSI|nr:unnamed protein product [Linum tenue]
MKLYVVEESVYGGVSRKKQLRLDVLANQWLFQVKENEQALLITPTIPQRLALQTQSTMAGIHGCSASFDAATSRLGMEPQVLSFFMFQSLICIGGDAKLIIDKASARDSADNNIGSILKEIIALLDAMDSSLVQFTGSVQNRATHWWLVMLYLCRLPC